MTEYLVESHIGGYYTSTDDPDTIMECCDSCGDSDSIITSWDDEIENSMYNELKNHIISTYYTSEQEAINGIKIKYSCYESKSFKECLIDFIEYREYTKMKKDHFIDMLFECDIIDKSMKKSLLSLNTKSYNKESKILDDINDKSDLKIKRKFKN